MNKRVYHGTLSALLFLALLIVVSMGFQASQAWSAETVSESAVYKLSDDRIDLMRKACDKAEDFFACYVDAFQKAGAPAEAVQFIKAVGEPGFMTDFKKVGPVDIAFVDLPFRANENRGCFLVNGDPQIVNVDDLSTISGTMLEKNSTYRGLKKKYPDIGLWMGNRQGTSFISVSRGKKGALRFSLPYRLTESCRACADIGQAVIAYDFNGTGRFIGSSVVTVKPVK